jgi:uncharacterized protein YcfJ
LGKKVAALGAASALLALPAMAQEGYYAQGPDPYAEVLAAAPTYRQVQVAQPNQVCQNVQVTQGGSPGNQIAGTLLGGAIGGLAGHAFGKGSGNTAMTAAGAVAGAVAGNRIASNLDQPTTSVQQQCQVVNNVYYQQQLTGYDVTYRYAGITYHSHMPYAPPRNMPVHVVVTPVLAPPGPPPGPAPYGPPPPPPAY